MSGAGPLAAEPRPPRAALCAAVALLAGAVLAAEVLLARLLSIVLWHHFAYLVVSLALLGLAAAGSLLAWRREALLAGHERHFALLCVLFATSFVVATGRAARAPFNPLALGWDAREWLALGGLAGLLLVPFLCAAMAVGLALMRHAGHAGRLYGADLVGAGAGALAAVVALEHLEVGTALAGVAGLGLAAGLVARAATLGRWRTLGAALAALAALGAVIASGWLVPRPSPYKGLSLVLRAPGARIIAESSGPLGLLSVVESPIVPIRQAPGLSLAAPQGPAPQLGLFIDANGPLPLIGSGARGWLSWTPEALAHALGRPRRRVLVLGAGGGGALARALDGGAREVVVAEADAKLIGLLTGPWLPAPVTARWRRPEVALVHAEARHFLAREAARFDLVELPMAGDQARSAGGLGALGESRLYTVEAFRAALARLAPGGVVAASTWLRLPPRASVKLLATAIAALRRAGVDDPGARLVVVRGWQSAALLVRGGPFPPAEVGAARRFAASRGFDLAWYPGMPEAEANRRNRWPAPYLYRAARALLGPGAGEFVRGYKFEVAPATDDRPFFQRFVRWKALPELLGLRAGAGLAQIDWGYPVLVASVALGAVLGALLVLGPLALAGPPQAWRPLAPFVLIGLAFMLIEMAYIERLVIFLGHPTRALSVALAGFLVSAGAGSLAAAPVVRLTTRGAGAACLVVAVLAVLAAGLLPAALGYLIALPDAARVALALAAIAPLAIPMGMPFPLLLAALGRERAALVPWAWGVNGLASVIATALGTLLAVHLGFRAVVVLAASLYLGAALSMGRGRS